MSIRLRREKVFGAGRAIPLDRNAKARVMVYASAPGAPVTPAGPATQLSADPYVPGGAAMGLPQQPLRRLLPQLRIHCRQGRLRPFDRSRGAGVRHRQASEFLKFASTLRSDQAGKLKLVPLRNPDSLNDLASSIRSLDAPMAFAGGGRLAAAVTEAGGLGLIGGGYGNAEWIEREFTAAGNTRVGCGFITWSLARQPELLDRVLSHAPAALMLSFGDPAPFAPWPSGAAGSVLICQVQTLPHARGRPSPRWAEIIVARRERKLAATAGSRATLTPHAGS